MHSVPLGKMDLGTSPERVGSRKKAVASGPTSTHAHHFFFFLGELLSPSSTSPHTSTHTGQRVSSMCQWLPCQARKTNCPTSGWSIGGIFCEPPASAPGGTF